MMVMLAGAGYGAIVIAIVVGLLLWADTEREMFKANEWPQE